MMAMRPGSPTFLTILALGVSSCGAVGFDLTQDLQEQRVPGSPLGGVLPSLVPNPFKLTLDVKAETQKRGTGPATAVFLKELTLSATPAATPSGTFDFLDEVHVFIESSSQAKVEVAKLKPVPRGVSRVTFDVLPAVDLLPSVNAGATLTTSATGTQPAKDFTFTGQVVVTVKL